MKPKPFKPVKPVCGLIFSNDEVYRRGKNLLVRRLGPADRESPAFPFDSTDYYEPEMGGGLSRRFLSFERLIRPEELPGIKVFTNDLEESIREESRSNLRNINIDPGYLNGSALIFATAKDFSHRIPLAEGIYAHLELQFGKNEVRYLAWTYPDFRNPGYSAFFLEVREIYLRGLKHRSGDGSPFPP